jgi:predicted ribosomally synthesized peptide with SipW-like signal peptide
MIKMRAFNKIILFGMMITPLIFSQITFACLTGNTFAYFSDTASTAKNTITAGWGNESSFLMVSDSKLTGNGEKLHGITFDVNGIQNVTIDKFQVWWDSSQGDASHIIKITIDGKEFFSGSKYVGEMVDGEDYLLEAGSSARLELYFDKDVSDLAPFTINVVMGDGSVKSFVTDPKYRSDDQEDSVVES